MDKAIKKASAKKVEKAEKVEKKITKATKTAKEEKPAVIKVVRKKAEPVIASETAADAEISPPKATKAKAKTKAKASSAAKPYYATGRRKSSSARVFISRGKGAVTINDRTFENYFSNEIHRMLVLDPIKSVGMEGKFDVKAVVCGGGASGQAGAVRLGVARALLKYDTESGEGEAGALGFRPVLRAAGFLTRDSREVERKKVGLHKARKRPQYSKR